MNRTHRKPNRNRWMQAGVLALATGASMLASCNIAAPVFYAVHGPPKVEAQYTLDPAATTVVFIDDPASKVGRRRLRGEIGNAASGVLLNRGLVNDMVDSNAILLAASKERYGEPMSITELGKTVEADIVIYALMTEFSLSPDSQTFAPGCTMMVKVLDTRTGERLWPADPQGHPVTIQPKTRAGALPTDAAGEAIAENELATRAGLGLAQTFYKYEAHQSASR